jgi:hypothetical protein
MELQAGVPQFEAENLMMCNKYPSLAIITLQRSATGHVLGFQKSAIITHELTLKEILKNRFSKVGSATACGHHADIVLQPSFM